MIPDIVQHILFEFADDPWLSDQTIKAQYLIGRLIRKYSSNDVRIVIESFDLVGVDVGIEHVHPTSNTVH